MCDRADRGRPVLLLVLMSPDRLVLDLTFLNGGPSPDFRRVGALAQELHNAPGPFEGHLFRDHLLFTFPRRDEAQLVASCAAFVSSLNHEGRAHRGRLVDGVTREYEGGNVHHYPIDPISLPGIVISAAICDRLPLDLLGSSLARFEGETVISPFAGVDSIDGVGRKSAWLSESRLALQETANSPALDCPRFDWLFEMLDATASALAGHAN